jgi:hypothetical protein
MAWLSIWTASLQRNSAAKSRLLSQIDSLTPTTVLVEVVPRQLLEPISIKGKRSGQLY